MNGQGKSFTKVTLRVPLFMNTKETCFFHFFAMLLISRKDSSSPLFNFFDR